MHWVPVITKRNESHQERKGRRSLSLSIPEAVGVTGTHRRCSPGSPPHSRADPLVVPKAGGQPAGVTLGSAVCATDGGKHWATWESHGLKPEKISTSPLIAERNLS